PRRGVSLSATTFSRKPRDSLANCDQSAIEFVALSAYHPAVVALFFAVSHLSKHRTSNHRSSRSLAWRPICHGDSSGGIMRRLLVSFLMVLLALSVKPVIGPASSAAYSDPPTVAPEEVGLASSRLAHIRSVMDRHVAEKQIPGAAGLIARHGKI